MDTKSSETKTWIHIFALSLTTWHLARYVYLLALVSLSTKCHKFTCSFTERIKAYVWMHQWVVHSQIPQIFPSPFLHHKESDSKGQSVADIVSWVGVCEESLGGSVHVVYWKPVLRQREEGRTGWVKSITALNIGMISLSQSPALACLTGSCEIVQWSWFHLEAWSLAFGIHLSQP